MKFIIPIFIIFLALTNCSDKGNDLKIKIVGHWAYSEKIDDDYLYAEVIISNDSIRFNDEYSNFTFSYKLEKNEILYNDKSLEVEVINDFSLNLKNDFASIVVYRVTPTPQLNSSEVANPFYLRRLNFLVNKGHKTIQEAMEAICPKDNDWLEEVEEEEIAINRK